MSKNAEQWLKDVENLPPSKYSADDVCTAVENLGGSETDFWFDPNYYTLAMPDGNLVTPANVEEFGGGEGDGETRYVVFKIGEQTFRKDGWYASYDGTTWDGDCYECFPHVRTITEYNRRK